MNKNQINYYSDGLTEPTGDDSYYNEKEKEKLTLKSIISVNEKYDLKTSMIGNIYKGRNYKHFNKIKDNLLYAQLTNFKNIKEKDLIKDPDYNRDLIKSTIVVTISSNISSFLFLPISLSLNTLNLKEEYRNDDIKRDIMELQLKINSTNVSFINILNLAKDGFNLNDLNSVKTKAELKPIFDTSYSENEDNKNMEEQIFII